MLPRHQNTQDTSHAILVPAKVVDLDGTEMGMWLVMVVTMRRALMCLDDS